jgi:hypothetical protein
MSAVEKASSVRGGACSTLAVGSCALLGILASGCSSFYRYVPFENELTLASVSEPPRSVRPVKDKVTLIVAQSGGDYSGGKKSFTYVLEDGTFLGQSTARGWFVVEVPPGRHTVLMGLPEFGEGGCLARRDDFVAGKVYVLDDAQFVDAEGARRDLSLYTFLRADSEVGQEAVQRDMGAYWRTCIDAALAALDREEANPRSLMSTQKKAAEVAVDTLEIPSPP